jgi:hypothetical protein
MKLVLLNGPAGSGKDTAGRALAVQMGAKVVRFASPLKLATHALYGLDGAPADAFEHVKEAHSGLFFGLSPRQAYIEVSERMIKPALGNDFFGRVLAQRLVGLRDSFIELAVATDSGFVGEALPVVEAIGAANVLLIRLHAEGRGCSFRGDSRGHIKLPGVAALDVHNDGPDPAAFCRYVVALVRGWLAEDAARQATTCTLEAMGAA